jgi:hypothetical protein
MLDPDRTAAGRIRPGRSGKPADRSRGSLDDATVAAEGVRDGQFAEVGAVPGPRPADRGARTGFGGRTSKCRGICR